MNKFATSLAVATALVVGTVTPANAATWPDGDTWWTVNYANGQLTARNPITHAVSQTIKGSKRVHAMVIGGTWDPVRDQFILIDGWTMRGGHESKSGLVTYNPSSKKWVRYAIDLGSGNTKGYAVRDLAVAMDGSMVLLVERDADNYVQANYLVNVGILDKKRHKAFADFADSSTVHLALTDNILNSIVFDPSTPGVLYAADYAYRFYSINASNGSTNWSHPIDSAPSESNQMDIDSSGHFWAFGDYGHQLSWGLIANDSQNQEVEASTGCTNTCEVFIIQRG